MGWSVDMAASGITRSLTLGQSATRLGEATAQATRWAGDDRPALVFDLDFPHHPEVSMCERRVGRGRVGCDRHLTVEHVAPLPKLPP